jgi:predicted nicotinamide N-methyase
MAKKQVTWQLDPKLVDKIKARAKKNKVAIQVLAEELLTKGIEI